MVAVESRLQGTGFVVRGLESQIRLGDDRTGILSCIAGSAEILAPVCGVIVVPMPFIFPFGGLDLKVHAVVGDLERDWADLAEETSGRPVIEFKSTREGGLGGILSVQIRACLQSFVFDDRSDLGGLGEKAIVVSASLRNLVVAMKGKSNFANFRLTIAGNKQEDISLEVFSAHALRAQLEEDGDTVRVSIEECESELC